MYRIIISLLFLIFVTCKEKIKHANVTGKVVNAGTGVGIDSVLVFLQDGVGNSGPINFGSTSSGTHAQTITNSNGEFSLSIDGEYTPYISARKEKYKDFQYVVGGAGQGIMPLNWGKSNVVLTLEAPSNFCGIFAMKSGYLNIDSLIIDFLDYNYYKNGHFGPHCKGDGLNQCGCEMCFKFSESIDFCKNNYVAGLTLIGDKYMRFNASIKRNGVWASKTDSVYLASFKTFRDTVYLDK